MPNKYGVKCPKCRSRDVWKWGFVSTSHGHKDRFRCIPCGHVFHKGQQGALVGQRVKAKRTTGG